jgi:hypothetical protein
MPADALAAGLTATEAWEDIDLDALIAEAKRESDEAIADARAADHDGRYRYGGGAPYVVAEVGPPPGPLYTDLLDHDGRHRYGGTAPYAVANIGQLARPRACERRHRVRAARPRQRRERRRTVRSSAKSGDSGPSDGPGDAGPLTVAARLAASSVDYARCPECGGVLVWADGRLTCAVRSCPGWGQ